MLVLGLDISSTTIGYALSDGSLYGDVPILGGDIAAKCRNAQRQVAALLDTYRPALVVIESPVRSFFDAMIAQAHVRGAVLSLFGERHTLWQFISPSEATKALTGKGDCPKGERKRIMIEAARRRLGLPAGDIMEKDKKWSLWYGGKIVLSEDAADAYGLAVSGGKIKVEVVK